MKIYFAGAIRGGREDAKKYGLIISCLQKYGKVLTEHISLESLTAKGDKGETGDIYNRDLSWLKESDIVVTDVTVPSLGVGYELAKAIEWNKKIVCLFQKTSGKRLSAMIDGCPEIKVINYGSITEVERVLSKMLPKLIKENENEL